MFRGLGGLGLWGLEARRSDGKVLQVYLFRCKRG